jgi:hypothetical protein
MNLVVRVRRSLAGGSTRVSEVHAFAIVGVAAVVAACVANSRASTRVPDASASTPPTVDSPHTASARDPSVTGTVAETLDAASYSYLRLTTLDGDQWAAVPRTHLAVGDHATIVSPMLMVDFHSPTLGRTFDRILFGTLEGQAPMPSMSRANAEPPAVATAPDSPVAKANGPDAFTVAEVLARKSALKDRPVVLRGRVTKMNAAIMGKNWLHLEDGSPGASEILVTTSGTASVGDVVTARGTIRTDRDFGSGYSYAVMIEDATLTR